MLRVCPGCEVSRPLEEHGRSARCRPCSSARMRARRLDAGVRSRQAISARQYREANPEAVARRNAAWLERNKAARKAYRTKQYAKNKVRENEQAAAYKAERKEDLAAKQAVRLRSSPEKGRRFRSKRRAAERNAIPSWVDHEKIADMFLLAELLSQDSGERYEVDHEVPLQSKFVCGLHWHGNLRALPARENRAKSNRHWPDMPDILEARA